MQITAFCPQLPGNHVFLHMESFHSKASKVLTYSNVNSKVQSLLQDWGKLLNACPCKIKKQVTYFQDALVGQQEKHFCSRQEKQGHTKEGSAQAKPTLSRQAACL